MRTEKGKLKQLHSIESPKRVKLDDESLNSESLNKESLTSESATNKLSDQLIPEPTKGGDSVPLFGVLGNKVGASIKF